MEVIGRYSNPLRTPVDLRKLNASTPPKAREKAETGPVKQRQRRLRSEEVENLKSDYLAGTPVLELTKRYGITRQTVLEHMRRLAVPRRHPKLDPRGVSRAEALYRRGKSLASVGAALEVDPGTVLRALIAAGVPIRDCHGRPRSA